MTAPIAAAIERLQVKEFRDATDAEYVRKGVTTICDPRYVSLDNCRAEVAALMRQVMPGDFARCGSCGCIEHTSRCALAALAARIMQL